MSAPRRARFQLRLGLALLPAALLSACGDSVASGSGRVYRDPLTFGTSSLPAAYLGEPYEAALDLRGGTGPYGVKVASGELPQGLRLSNQRLSGTPVKSGSFRFTLEANDANLSSKAQEYTLNVGDLPPLKLSLELPRAEIRGATRVPLNITAPRTARAARVTWEVPQGAKVTRVQGGPSSGLLKWEQKGQTLTLDLGFRAVPRSGEQVALLHVEPERPLTLDAKTFRFRVLDGSGKELPAPPTASGTATAPVASGTATALAASGTTTAPTTSGAAAATVPTASSAATAPAEAASGAATVPAGFPPRPAGTVPPATGPGLPGGQP
ncbi:hypothetical protein GCM10017783_22140 [Deinococcus piscis]|uniref:Uncharacterized protein n=1 Tax=Deinococcus piscis TaxID=394230 RepID=A0ABQ3KG42_9DEIO|nr:hypothetical protein GCM10017783_22140 [Deinococcus piscis]